MGSLFTQGNLALASQNGNTATFWPKNSIPGNLVYKDSCTHASTHGPPPQLPISAAIFAVVGRLEATQMPSEVELVK